MIPGLKRRAARLEHAFGLVERAGAWRRWIRDMAPVWERFRAAGLVERPWLSDAEQAQLAREMTDRHLDVGDWLAEQIGDLYEAEHGSRRAD